MSEVGHTGDQAGAQTSVGQLLREARERANLSAADVARQLRLALRQVEALEANDFGALPGNTIVRGFIRNYAKLLQLDPARYLAAYEAGAPPVGGERIAVEAENIDISPHASRRWVWYLGAAALVAVGVPLLIYALLHDDRRLPASPPESVSTHPAPLPPPAPSVPAAPDPAAVTPPAAGGAPEPAQAVTAGAATAEAKPASASGIQLAFDDDSWVEIRDRSRRKIFSQLNRKGGEESVSGEAPFTLVIGNAAKVRLTYNGKPVNLQPYIKVNVARLTLE